MACPLGERKGRTRHRRVTTVSSTDIYIFLAPRSARRSDASNTAGRSAGGSLWRQREPGRKWRSRVQTPVAHAQPGWHRHLAPRSADRTDASDAAGRSAGESLRRQRQPAKLRRPRVRTHPGSGRQRKNLRRTHARARAAALVRSCVGATRRRPRAIPPAAPTLGRGRPNSPFGVCARRRGWASALRAGERLTTLTSPPLDQNVRARAPPRALPASHLTRHWRMAAKAPRGAMEILGRALSGS